MQCCMSSACLAGSSRRLRPGGPGLQGGSGRGRGDGRARSPALLEGAAIWCAVFFAIAIINIKSSPMTYNLISQNISIFDIDGE